MARYLLRRAVMLVVTLLVSSFVVFAGMSMAPGDPIAALAGGRSLPAESVEVLEQQYHLDDPFLVRYATWVGNALQGDLGFSIGQRQEVSHLIASRAGTTIELVLFASLLVVGVGVGVGLIAALRSGKVDATIVVLTSIVVAVPPFVAAILLIMIFSVGLGWFPAFGTGDGLLDTLRHLTLPAVALAAAATASVARITRTTVREQLGRDYMQTAIGRGLPPGAIVRRHALRNSLVPIITLTGVTTASMIALAAVVERAFSLNGLGAYLVDATLSKDLAVVQGICLVLVTAYVVVNTLVDVLAAMLDPRIVLGAKR